MKKVVGLLLVLGIAAACSSTAPQTTPEVDPYAKYVWPPPPDQARIRLTGILTGRIDVEGDSRLEKALIGARQDSPFDKMKRPMGVAFDQRGRVLVTDAGHGALLRFDRETGVMDVLGTRSSMRLRQPLSVKVGPDDLIYVADVGQAKILVFDESGEFVMAYGRAGELLNPTDMAVSPDGTRLFVTDSKAHQIVVFDLKSGDKVDVIGKRGVNAGEFNYPTALAFDSNGELFVVDQINGRIQIIEQNGQVVEILGELGVGFGNFVRPKSVATDERGYVYVTDAAFNNVQIFNYDLELLTWVGSGGMGPGQFQNAGAVAVFKDEFAIVDQLNLRVQLFRYIDASER